MAEASEIVRLEGRVRFHLLELPPAPAATTPPLPAPAAAPVRLPVERAAQIQAAARALLDEGHGVGEHLVWICDVIARTGVSPAELLELHQAEELWLQGAEMPQTLPRDKLEASRLEHRRSAFVFVRVATRPR